MDFSLKEIELLIKLLDFRPENNFNYKSISKYLELEQTDGRFRKIQKWLKDNGSITENGKLGNNALLIFNYKRLKESIPEIDFIKNEIHNKLMVKHFKIEYWKY